MITERITRANAGFVFARALILVLIKSLQSRSDYVCRYFHKKYFPLCELDVVRITALVQFLKRL